MSIAIHRGELGLAFLDEHAKIYASPLKRQTSCARYRCTDCPPFDAYIRWSEYKVAVANISGKGRKPEKAGRIPIILTTLERMFSTIVIEQVLNPHLAATLRTRYGYVEETHPGCETFTWHRPI